MGQEIETGSFTEEDFARFATKLEQESRLLQDWFESGTFSAAPLCGGFELEAWLVDQQGMPAPINTEYLAQLDDELVVPELSSFNIELNSTPRLLEGRMLARMHEELDATWQRCRDQAMAMDVDLAMIGILPTVRDEDLTLEHMSRMTRYEALNEQVMRLREGRPLLLDIRGEQHLKSTHHDVMLEAAATSFQVHLQVPAAQAYTYYNMAQVISAPMTAACANSPFLFGRRLWEETRIPLFERAVEIGGLGGAAFGPLRRVSFGSGYARGSLFEIFAENQAHFPVLLPNCFDTPPEQMNHVRLHNGTIWRWNRPLIGFDADGTPHLRIEHRVIPAGPTVIDAIANTAMVYGLITELVQSGKHAEQLVEFSYARDNFYAAARHGLQAQFYWQGKHIAARNLILDTLVPLARRGLERQALAREDIDNYLGIIEARVATQFTGAHWQRAFATRHDNDMQALTAEYLRLQHAGSPVHEWPGHES
ncbi:MAG: glutamate--cysteine ligase [Granulosicoccaceae bacterium]|jgi:hypothetical protein